MSPRLLSIAWLTALWIILWRDLSIANLLSGVVLAAAASSGVTDWARERVAHRVAPLALVRFLVYFAWKLIEANVVLAREVITPTNVIRTGIISVALPGYSDFLVTVVGNAISLTPGTLTLDVRRDDEPVLYVHVLHLHDADATRAELMGLAERARAAFPQGTSERSDAASPGAVEESDR